MRKAIMMEVAQARTNGGDVNSRKEDMGAKLIPD